MQSADSPSPPLAAADAILRGIDRLAQSTADSILKRAVAGLRRSRNGRTKPNGANARANGSSARSPRAP